MKFEHGQLVGLRKGDFTYHEIAAHVGWTANMVLMDEGMLDSDQETSNWRRSATVTIWSILHWQTEQHRKTNTSQVVGEHYTLWSTAWQVHQPPSTALYVRSSISEAAVVPRTQTLACWEASDRVLWQISVYHHAPHSWDTGACHLEAYIVHWHTSPTVSMMVWSAVVVLLPTHGWYYDQSVVHYRCSGGWGGTQSANNPQWYLATGQHLISRGMERPILPSSYKCVTCFLAHIITWCLASNASLLATRNRLSEHIDAAWLNILQDEIWHHLQSMLQCVQAIITTRGGFSWLVLIFQYCIALHSLQF